jgi:hypothetical protein
MDELDRLRNVIATTIEKCENGSTPEVADMTARAAEALKAIADIEQSRAEASKLKVEESKLRYELDHAPQHDRSQHANSYILLLTPILTTGILAATLVLQGYQFTQSERDKRIATEDAQWSLAPSAVILNPFLKSDRYGKLARRTAIQLMVKSDDPLLFADLFRSAFQPLEWERLPEVLDLNRTLTQGFYQVAPLNQRNASQQSRYDYAVGAINALGPAVASLLRAPRPNSVSLSLTGTYFMDCDWRRVDLTGADLRDTWLVRVRLEGADLSGVTEFAKAHFDTAWWEADRIAPKLLEHLLKENPYPTLEYAGESVSREQYEAAIARLKR